MMSILHGVVLEKIADKAMDGLAQLGQETSDVFARNIHSTDEERKKQLMEKVRRIEITLKAAEDKGDLVKAILLGASLLFVAWIIYQLLKNKSKKK